MNPKIQEHHRSKPAYIYLRQSTPGQVLHHRESTERQYALIAWGLGTLFTNFEWARWMGANGRKAVETTFNWDGATDHVLSVYHQ